MGPTISLKLTAICLISSTVPASYALTAAIDAAQAFGLLSRATNTCTAGMKACNIPGQPSNFCCPTGSTCTAFNDNKSVMCCPLGRDCKMIAPLTCDINAQNASLHPNNPLHSTDLSGTLQTCGSNCCPKGFACSNGQCLMQAAPQSSAKPSSSNPAASNPAASTVKPVSSTISSSASASASKTPGPTSASSSESPIVGAVHCEKFPASAILVGFFPGMILGALLTVAAIICIGRRRAKKEHEDEINSVAATVSDPIYQDSGTFRTDFLRRESKSKYSNRTSKVRSLFSRSPTLKSNSAGHNRSVPKTPPSRTPEMKREPSMESIKIYSPPNGQLQRPTTTFTEMMADAGFKHGAPYLGSPGRVDPRSRGPY
ncbi:MAG: hypothetical protein Q9214_006482 [Letrouitia sp. 1 TL-2023]